MGEIKQGTGFSLWVQMLRSMTPNGLYNKMICREREIQEAMRRTRNEERRTKNEERRTDNEPKNPTKDSKE